MDLQMPMRSAADGISLSNPLISGLLSQSQSQRKNPPSTEEMAGMISAEVKQHHSYVIKKPEINASGNRISTQASGVEPSEQIDENENEEEDDEEYVDKEDVVKAWKFGSTWVPVPEKTFTTMDTRKGIEVLGFFPVENVRKYRSRAKNSHSSHYKFSRYEDTISSVKHDMSGLICSLQKLKSSSQR